MAGVVACWAQAVPDLTVEDVKNALRVTSIREYANKTADPHDGDGWLRPYEGLEYLLEEAGVATGVSDSAAPCAVFRGDAAHILNPGGGPIDVGVYDLTGVQRLSVMLNGPVSDMELGSLAPGVYAMVISKGAGSPVCLKFMR